MISIKHLLAAVALGTFLVAAPAVATAKVTPTAPTKLIHKKHKLTTHRSHKSALLTRSHVKGKALHTSRIHASKLTTHKLASHKTVAAKLTAGWKHHRSI